MAIKNDMESLVRIEVRKQRESRGRGREVCWCPRCEADYTAFALNQLPPRYCHEMSYGHTATMGFGEKVRSAVARAVDKIGKRPKHRPGRPEIDGNFRVLNYAQEVGTTLVGPVLAQATACACDQCRADTLAVALNRYPPKYGVSGAGRETYQANYEDFIRHELAQMLTQAATVIRTHPHH